MANSYDDNEDFELEPAVLQPKPTRVNREPVYLTTEGKERLAALRAELQAKRPDMAERVAEAARTGDLNDNPDYEVAKMDQAFLEGRIAELDDQLKRAIMIEPSGLDEIGLGSRITLSDADGDELQFTLVGRAEAAPSAGRISNVSPLGKALIGHTTGDEVEFEAPAGLQRYKVLAVV
jgi:transcription elongation factor GreA